MEASKVYYTDFRCPVGTSLLDKLRRVWIKDIDMDGKFVAIKMHFGELGNLAFLRTARWPVPGVSTARRQRSAAPSWMRISLSA